MSEDAYSAMVRWAEQRPETYEMDPVEVQRRWRRATGYRERPVVRRRYRMPRGVTVDVGPVTDEKEWDWHE